MALPDKVIEDDITNLRFYFISALYIIRLSRIVIQSNFQEKPNSELPSWARLYAENVDYSDRFSQQPQRNKPDRPGFLAGLGAGPRLPPHCPKPVQQKLPVGA